MVGREWGEQVLRKIPDRLLDEDRLQKARVYIRRMGAKGVILGRWTAALRALVPGLAGMAHMSYPRFLVANIIGGVGWALTVGDGRAISRATATRRSSRRSAAFPTCCSGSLPLP